ncbi:MAG: hypothetical protein IPL53_06580 [Ignavibacteria bacterium]|nr:hypothetical protein [Ignavibacteria bacterium]
MQKPSGTVTFLFTDIEGSTELAQKLGGRLQSVLDIHDSIMHKAVESNGGFVFEVIGDGFCCAFANAAAAVKAACDAQLMLYSEEWDETIVRVRMGINTGDAEWNGHRYFGYLTLAKTNRIMSAGYGGQILISQNTFSLLKDNMQDHYSVIDLGEKCLKDLKKPEFIYQIVLHGLRSDFPPLKTSDAKRNNLPVQPTKFIGRERDISGLKELLLNNSLVTLTGTGGAGKTRLSIETADLLLNEFKDGVWFFDFSALTNPCHILQSVASVFKLAETGSGKLLDVVKNYLRNKEMLLILDNCEHVISESSKLAEIFLRSCPRIKILATSREALKIAGEINYHIPALTMPELKEDLTGQSLIPFESVKLFLNRAKMVKPDFVINNSNATVIAKLCRELDGIPLAIELAAARLRVLSPLEILENIHNRFELLKHDSRNVSPRQQTLRSLIDWSYNLLSEKEKTLFGRLSVFKGGFSLQSATEVCSGKGINKNEMLDLITSLTEKSLVVVNESGNRIRYRMLETIRQYSEERYCNKKEMQRKHFNYFLKLSEKSESKLKGAEQFIWIGILESELDNLRAAIRWSLKEDPEKCLRLVSVISYFWYIKNYINEAIDFSLLTLKRNENVKNKEKISLLYSTGDFLTSKGKFEKAGKFYSEAVRISVKLKDPENKLRGNIKQSQLLFYKGNNTAAEKKLKTYITIAKKYKDKTILAEALRTIGVVYLFMGKYDQGMIYFKRSLDIFIKKKHLWQIAISRYWLGRTAYQKKDYSNTRSILEELIPEFKKFNDRVYTGTIIQNLGQCDFDEGHLDSALELNEECYTLFKESGITFQIPVPLLYIARIHFLKGNLVKSKEVIKEIIGLSSEIKIFRILNDCISALAAIAMKNGDKEKAVRLFSFHEYISKKYDFSRLDDNLDYLGDNVNLLRSELDEQKFNIAFKEGRSMKMKDALEYGLKN